MKKITKCLHCGKEYFDFRLKCETGCDAFLRSDYYEKNFNPGNEKSLFKFLEWLPCGHKIETTISPIVYKSRNLAKKLGLTNLYIAFNGYWPEMGAENITGTFKDFEALPTLLNFIDQGKKRIILSSAGNTARAFAYATTLLDFDTYIVIPGKMLHKLWLPTKKSIGRTHIISISGSQDYYRAIQLSEKIARECRIDPEGGAKNLARRDGLGVVMLEAARVIGKLPAQYFQAVGSGTGAIASYEASLRLLGDKKFQGQHPPKLNLVQNEPFTPIYNAWKTNTPIQPDINMETQLNQIDNMWSEVLANRNPPFNIKGGVGDVLKLTGGVVHCVNNDEAIAASKEFEELEGIDIEPAASVCAAALKKAVLRQSVDKEEIILLNITGGGLKKLERDYDCFQLEPEFVVDDDLNFDWIKNLF
ncbi:MAG TPA: cysteate synthase [Candidatus Kapabacteria bacterium]|nr:cysteate synthase [Candidatus Kapabacteria bacterium]